MNEIVVSFCIPTYNRVDMLKELVLNILSSPNPNFEIIVMDNCSTDSTLEMLKTISDTRLHVYTHASPVKPFVSWYDTLEKASGNWIFHVIDRDWIDASKIDLLISTLQELDKQNVGFAVAGEKFSKDSGGVQLFSEGLDTLLEFALRHSHPTGQIFRRADWNNISDRRKFFSEEKYGEYPHGYIYAILGNTKKGAYLHFDICDKIHYSKRVIRTISTVYTSNPEKKEWFWPESRYRLLTLAAENTDLITNSAHIKPFMLSRYATFFHAVTREWYANCHNEILKKRYNRPELETNYISLMANGFDYILLFRQYLEENNFHWADEEFYTNLCNLDVQHLYQLTKWTNELRIKDIN